MTWRESTPDAGLNASGVRGVITWKSFAKIWTAGYSINESRLKQIWKNRGRSWQGSKSDSGLYYLIF
jgi:hypothetical protein